jgi:Leucine-rich repeat (LRR) protein
MGCCCLKKTDAEKQGLQPGFPPPNGEQPKVIGKSSKAQPASKDVLLDKIGKAAKTRVLIFRECGLKSIPDGALKEPMAMLRTVDLEVNSLSVLPSNIMMWAELQSLQASDNLLESLPDAITRLPKLQKLGLSRNRLRALPEGLGDLSLKELKCDGNMLTALPDVFGGNIAATLSELEVQSNQLESLPTSFCNLRSLTRLLLQQNKLSDLRVLAQSGEGLSRLQHVNAADNKITSIEPATLRLPALSELWLKGNPTDRLVLQATEGFNEFADRRKQRLDQKIDQNVVGQVDLSMCGL